MVTASETSGTKQNATGRDETTAALASPAAAAGQGATPRGPPPSARGVRIHGCEGQIRGSATARAGTATAGGQNRRHGRIRPSMARSTVTAARSDISMAGSADDVAGSAAAVVMVVVGEEEDWREHAREPHHRLPRACARPLRQRTPAMARWGGRWEERGGARASRRPSRPTWDDAGALTRRSEMQMARKLKKQRKR